MSPHEAVELLLLGATVDFYGANNTPYDAKPEPREVS